MLPASSVRSDRNSREASGTSTSPVSRISKMPISLVLPKRFFTARKRRYSELPPPSKYSTVSTICSSTLGPARVPSLVTCPTTNTAMPLVLASRKSSTAHSLTWLTLPGALCTSGRKTVWMESTTRSSGFSCSTCWPICSRFVSLTAKSPSCTASSLSARIRTCRTLSSPVT